MMWKKILQRSWMVITLVMVLLCFAQGQRSRYFAVDEPTPRPINSYLMNYLPYVNRPDIYYVSTTGKNTNQGRLNQPWRTIQFAVDHVRSGAIISVRAGDYNEAVEITSAGQPNKPITLNSFENEKVTIDGGNQSAITGKTSYWNIRNFKFDQQR